MYGEDADLSLRAAGAGVRRVITPDAVVTHEVGVSSESRPDKVLLLFRGKATLLRKHWGPVRSRIGVALLVSGVGLRTLEALIPGRSRTAGRRRASAWPAVWRARSDWVRGYTEPSSTQPARPPVQTERVSP
jgi:hypothetical protein